MVKTINMEFCTAITCMDGRIQLPVIKYLQEKFAVKYVDTITEAGPNQILHKQEEELVIQSILLRLNISVDAHKSVGIAVVGHYDCARNPEPKDIQIEHIKSSIKFIKTHYSQVEMIGLWVDENWEVSEVV